MSRYTAIQDGLTILPAQVRDYLSLTTDDPSAGDDPLNFLIAAAKEAADTYCQNDFLDADGVAETIPNAIFSGCMLWISNAYMRRVPGVVSDKTGDISISYDPMLLTEDVKQYWRPWRIIPGF